MVASQQIRIRLARHGRCNNPFYHIVAVQAYKRRNAAPLEKLGMYDPIPRVPDTAALPAQAKVFGGEKWEVVKEKKVEWNLERINYWLDRGAEPSESVVKLLERAGVLQTPHKWQHTYSPPASSSAPGPSRSAPQRRESRSEPSNDLPSTFSDTPPSPRQESAAKTPRPGSAGSDAVASSAGEMTGLAGQTAT